MAVTMNPIIQFGLDIATSIAILASAVTFLWNQKRKRELQNKWQLDNSVRSVATENVQQALQVLSHIHIDSVKELEKITSVVSKKNIDQIEKNLINIEGDTDDMVDSFVLAINNMSIFYDRVEAYRYQIYPVLNIIDDNMVLIETFEQELDKLIGMRISLKEQVLPLILDIEEILALCRQDDKDEYAQEVSYKVRKLIYNDKYKYWINSLIAEEDTHDVSNKVISDFIELAYDRPYKIRALAFAHGYNACWDTGFTCKKFLIKLAAINFILLKNDDKNKISEVITRYEGDDYFRLNRTMR